MPNDPSPLTQVNCLAHHTLQRYQQTPAPLSDGSATLEPSTTAAPTATGTVAAAGQQSTGGDDGLSRPAEIATICGTIFGALSLVATVWFGVKWRGRRRRDRH